jgi:hypothetical protein
MSLSGELPDALEQYLAGRCVQRSLNLEALLAGLLHRDLGGVFLGQLAAVLADQLHQAVAALVEVPDQAEGAVRLLDDADFVGFVIAFDGDGVQALAVVFGLDAVLVGGIGLRVIVDGRTT